MKHLLNILLVLCAATASAQSLLPNQIDKLPTGADHHGTVTVFPSPIAMAASWDDALVGKVITAISDELDMRKNDPKSIATSSNHKELAAQMSQKSIVLLWNQMDVLPLGNNFKPTSGSATDIAVMGPYANDSIVMWGKYKGHPTHTITAFEGIRTKANKRMPGARVRYVQSITEIGSTQTVIYVGGNPGGTDIPQSQRDMLSVLRKADKKVIFVNISNGETNLAPELKTCDAILQWWHAGEMGGAALAEILFGDRTPSGKMPITIYYNGRPMIPLGFGLTYTQFEIGQPAFINGRIEVKVSNVGNGNGAGAGNATETIQVYTRNTADAKAPQKTLQAYKQIELTAGESKTVSIPLPLSPGRYEIFVGNSSADRDLKKFLIDFK